MLKKLLLTLTAAITLLFPAGRAEAGQLKLLVGGAMTEPIKKVGADFSRKTSNKLDVTTNTTGALQGMLRAGEKADIIIISAPGMDALEREKLVVPGTRVELARGLIGVGVRAGAASPDLSSADAFKKAILAARSVSYVDPKAGGTSGTYMAGLFQRMGIAEEISKKTVLRNQGSEVADAVAKGEAEIGITFTSELIPNKGVKVAGTLPGTIQLPTNYAAAIPVGASNPDAARAFLKEMKTPAGQAAIREAGLEPIP
jgi:molybdate transport system substrate-binding protein